MYEWSDTVCTTKTKRERRISGAAISGQFNVGYWVNCYETTDGTWLVNCTADRFPAEEYYGVPSNKVSEIAFDYETRWLATLVA